MKKILVVAYLMVSSAGCMMDRAAFEAKDGSYHVRGQSTHPEAMAATLSANRQGELMAEGYKASVESGRMGPYGPYGGGYMTQGAFYGMPQQVVVQSQPSAPSSSGGSYATKGEVQAAVANGDAAREEAQEARRRADASLRMHRKLCERSGECPPASNK